MILVTGSEGLIGRAFCNLLQKKKEKFRRFDLKFGQDVCNSHQVREALKGCHVVVHLAAQTRVHASETNLVRCKQVNCLATEGLALLCAEMRIGLVFSSSREVYGEQTEFPVTEDAPKRPKNAYGVSKVYGEDAVTAIQEMVTANIVRFSNVYGDVEDHPDRLVPRMALEASRKGWGEVRGSDTTLDLVHVQDASQGLWRVVLKTMCGERLPPIHFVSGVGTTIDRVRNLAWDHGLQGVELKPTDPIHVGKFVGDPTRARKLLRWKAKIPIEEGFARLVEDFRKVRNEPASQRL